MHWITSLQLSLPAFNLNSSPALLSAHSALNFSSSSSWHRTPKNTIVNRQFYHSRDCVCTWVVNFMLCPVDCDKGINDYLWEIWEPRQLSPLCSPRLLCCMAVRRNWVEPVRAHGGPTLGQSYQLGWGQAWLISADYHQSKSRLKVWCH